MRILITSTPGAGHVHPIVPHARALVEAGHDVLWATAPDGCDRVARLGFAVTPAGIGTGIRLKEFLATTPGFADLPPRARRTVAFGGLFARVAAPRMRTELRPVFDRFRPDVVVHDIAELAAAPIATARAIPNVTVAFSGAIPEATLDRAVDEARFLWVDEGLAVPNGLGFADHLLLHPFPAAFGSRPMGARVRPARPVSVDGATVEDEAPDWATALGRERPAVYATFGTELGTRAPWPALLAPLGDLDVDVVATTGPGSDPAALGPVPPNVRIEAYVPQRFLLDRVSIVVSHSGAGTMLAAASRGLPQLCLPVAADQFENADALTRSGAGLMLEPEDRGPGAIAGTVNHLLVDGAIRDRARTVAAELHAMPAPHELVPEIERLATS